MNKLWVGGKILDMSIGYEDEYENWKSHTLFDRGFLLESQVCDVMDLGAIFFEPSVFMKKVSCRVGVIEMSINYEDNLNDWKREILRYRASMIWSSISDQLMRLSWAINRR
jgi:hypothetical protein